MLEVTVLALLQGIAEFLPISSSGHLVIGKSLLGLEEAGIRLDIFLHVGTLAAIMAFYWRVIWRVIKNMEVPYMVKIVLSAIPAGIVGVFFKDNLEAAFSSPRMVGGALIFTGMVLSATRFIPKGTGDVSYFRAILMGIAQAIAILPGVSRSGMTLAAARGTGVDGEKAAEFSFLMSAPPIAGAAMLEILKSMKETSDSVAQGFSPDMVASPDPSWGLTIYGAILAAMVGYWSLKLLVQSLKGRWFWLFGPYCLLAGILTIAFC